MSESDRRPIEPFETLEEASIREPECCAMCGLMPAEASPVCDECNRCLGTAWLGGVAASVLFTVLWMLGTRVLASHLGFHLLIAVPVAGIVWLNIVLFASRSMKRNGRYIIGDTIAEAWVLGTAGSLLAWIGTEFVLYLAM